MPDEYNHFRELVDKIHEVIHEYYRAWMRHATNDDGEYKEYEKDIKKIARKISKVKEI